MTTQETSSLLEKHLKKTTITSNVISSFIAIVIALSICYGFYFNTTATLSAHTTDIRQVKEDVVDIKNKLSDNTSFQGVTQAQQNDMKARIQRIEDKQDKLLELMITVNKNIKLDK